MKSRISDVCSLIYFGWSILTRFCWRFSRLLNPRCGMPLCKTHKWVFRRSLLICLIFSDSRHVLLTLVKLAWFHKKKNESRLEIILQLIKEWWIIAENWNRWRFFDRSVLTLLFPLINPRRGTLFCKMHEFSIEKSLNLQSVSLFRKLCSYFVFTRETRLILEERKSHSQLRNNK